MKKLLILFLFVTLLSCQRTDSQDTADKKQETVQASSIDPAKADSEKTSDTLTIDGKSVVFFSISQTEYDKIIQEEGEDSGINEIISDFEYYSSEVTDTLNKAGFKTILTTSKTFAIVNKQGDKRFINRDIKEGKVGILLFDGTKEPLLDYGVGTDIDYLSIVDEYFKKK
ncbi:hypothetical protein GU926_10165 [Nibribacter ruber]|uniref:DUF4252 domain-containing protein n=1 Tax=Nibribacter ruber TaxID=2698458 RepID=A0A6P1P1T4_9BACT|nr:hypothetical protein [Nibribacter ruber]QHL87772.1 hypothetical protein GU926_10165 [Nibribacter ruber]